MRLLNVLTCLLVPSILTGCYAAAWNRDTLDLWSAQTLPDNVAAQLPDLSEADEIRVLVFGDSGKPSTFETVAGWMAGTCAGECDFALVLGDNFYLRGPSGPNPEKFDEHFHGPLNAAGRGLADIPFWVVLGNHGYVDLFLLPPSDPTIQLAYTSAQQPGGSPLWLMPSLHYGIPGLPHWLTMAGFDSMVLSDRRAFDGSDEAYMESRAKLVEEIHRIVGSKGRDGWRVLFGHHPHVTIGAHADGNRMREVPDPFRGELPLIYFSGHDHDHQLIETGDGLVQVVQGAASKERARKWGSRKARPFFEETLEPQYAATGQTVSAEYCEKLGFAIAVFREHEFELAFHWGEADSAAPIGSASWSWRREGDRVVSRTEKAPAGRFVDLCPD